ncbi:MAG: hypothetical protein SFU56_17500 [Capsulimonadales bacterium]|nr:hypothetical protein [Capsulimonadales bacterium]
MEQWNSLESTEVWTAAKRCAFIVLCVSGALSATAAVLLIGAPGMVPTAGGMLLWGVIAVTLSAAVAGWERTPTGYLLLLIAATLEVFAPRIVPHLNPADMRETLSAFSQAAGMPMLVGALLAIKDLVQRVWFGLSLKRTEARIETAVDVMNLMSEDDGDAVRQNVKYRLLVVPTIVIAIGLYVSLVGTIRTGLNDALVQVNAVAT